MAEINELFEEGTTRSRELADAADAVMNAIDDMATEGEELARRVQEEGRETCQHLRELTTRLDQAEDELEAGRAAVEIVMEGLTAKGGELKTEAAELLACVKKSLDGLEECETACGEKVDELKPLVGLLVTQLQELASDVGTSANSSSCALPMANSPFTLRGGHGSKPPGPAICSSSAPSPCSP